MSPQTSHAAFASLSSFTGNSLLASSQTLQHAFTSPKLHSITMVAPKHVRRSEEIKRLTKQLEELRAVREKMKGKTASSPLSSSSSPPPPQPVQEVPPAPSVQPPTSAKPSSIKLGKHSEGSRFLSISDFPSSEFFPRIIPVPGTVPGLTVAQLEATPRVNYSRQPALGNVFTTNVPNQYQGDLIAMPMPETITDYIDPVVLRVKPSELSVSQLPCEDDDFVYVILDRGTTDSAFDNMKFYAWDVDGMVKIGWAKDKPAEADARCLGRLIAGTLEVRNDLRKKRSCWEEENEAYGQ